MVGRDEELSRLLTLLDDAEAGRSVVALVSGDAGVGKSRLVSEVTRLAAGRGFTVLSGQCAELGDSVPYLPLADALRGAGASSGVRDALSSRPALGRLLPEGGDGQVSHEDRSGLARQQMFGGVLGLLTELAAAAPVLLVLEDLHWADTSTRDLVTFLSRMLHRERVAIIGTYRTDDLHRRHPLRPVVAELQRLPSVIAVDLTPLNPTALAEHLTSAALGRLDARNGPPPASAATPPGAMPCPRVWPTCCSAGSSSCPTPPSGSCAWRPSPGGRPTTNWSGPRPAWRPTITRPRSGRRSRTSSWSPTAPTATCSGTPCCAKPSTPTCCRGSGPGCTPRWAPCCPTSTGL
jgi:nucleoside-triphosphatase THEP1